MTECGAVVPVVRVCGVGMVRPSSELALARLRAGHSGKNKRGQHGKYGELQEQDHCDVENLGHGAHETGEDASRILQFINDQPRPQRA